MRKICFWMFLAVSSLSAASFADEPLFSGLGTHHRKITTSSKKAQQYFDQGLKFLFAFNHDEAIRSFNEAAKLDPKCAMAYWGIANANGPHINNPIVDEEHAKAANAAITKALEKGMRANETERALINATRKRFLKEAVQDRAMLDVTYADAMREVWKKYPKDADVGALFAEAMMDLRPWDFWKSDYSEQPGTKEIIDTLRSVLEINPLHPQALHLSIHALEASSHPERAKDAADALRDLQPGLGHMVHMPSHIDVRTGSWQKAIKSNEKAIVADAAYRKIRPAQGFYRIYMAHNHHMLAYAAMMTGQSKKALAAIDTMVANMPQEWVKAMAPAVDGYVSMPFEVRIRFGKWDEILGQADYPEYLPISRAIRRAARAIAFAAKGDVVQAQQEQKEFGLAKQKIAKDAVIGLNTATNVFEVAEHLVNGEILLAQKDYDSSIGELEKAVKAEDALRYDEPPDWIQPTRHALGAALLAVRRFDEAAKVYRADLEKLPNNGWSLFGLSEALQSLGDHDGAAKAKKMFEEQWALADMKITTSCLCLTPN